MDRLNEAGLVDALRRRLAEQRPTLCVCLGMQLLFETSDESPGALGLGCVTGHVSRFPDEVRVPQLGWNQVEVDPSARLIQSGFAYFANSFRAKAPPAGWTAAMADYAGPFVAAMERGPVLACQFHPELSGKWGQSLVQRWLEDTAC